MNEFEDALREGLDAFRDATRAKEEIMEVIAAMSQAVKQLTEGRVFVEASRVQTTTLLHPFTSMMQRTTEMITNQLPEEELPDAIFAVRRGAERGKRAQLCRLKIDAEGYPVELTLAGRFLHANDRETLTATLVTLLRHPDVAGKIATVADLPGAEPVQRWLSAESESDRRKGYRLIADAFAKQEPISIEDLSIVRDAALDPDRGYEERSDCLTLLRNMGGLDEAAMELLVVQWFDDPKLTMAFSSVLAGVFDRTEHLPILLATLNRIDVPPATESPPTTDVASPGHRVSQALGGVRSALEFGKTTPLSADMRSSILSLCERFEAVPYLNPLLDDIKTLTS